MENIFGKKLKELREKHFPTESLRRLGKQFEDKGFGQYFYTQLSKMENGTLLPSEDFVQNIEKAYGLSSSETLELLTALMMEKLQKRNFVPKHAAAPAEAAQAVGKLFRKAKKKKQ